MLNKKYCKTIYSLVENICKNMPTKEIEEVIDVLKDNKNKKSRKYFRKCGVCGEVNEQSNMIRTNSSPNGWMCKDCKYKEHPEYEEEFYGKY